ncbi:MAG: DRTGG domain-containing protein [Rikenellaceae bacterium]|nr:DRTGG domain-containing protein [Rikenellaceae bacterium]MCL2692821.1 DRTGG domain-containing protein [Rikenellaceae bacterium]
MTLKDLCKLIDGRAVCGADRLDEGVKYGFASDLMSDVLTLKSDDFVLITGLANIQAIRTAEMSNVSYMVICRGKTVTEDMLELAEENDMVVIASPFSLFKCAGLLWQAGLKELY